MNRSSQLWIPACVLVMAGAEMAPVLASTSAPPAGVVPATLPAKQDSAWRVWSDPAGHKVEAEFRGLSGEALIVRTRAGQVYQLNLTKLVEADQVAARAMQQKLPAAALSVSQAAAKLDALVLGGLTKAGQKPNAPASEEQLVRRLYLDVAGRIPSARETAGFLADKAPDKRARLIDTLIWSEGYNSAMFNWLGDLLRVEDDYGKGARTFVYEEWIKQQILANRPWDGFVHDLLTADGRLSKDGPVGYLLRDRNMPLDSLSNTLTTFLGANVACAQCHDHPLAPWTQRDFLEMASFFGATEVGDASSKRMAKKVIKNSGLDKRIVLKLMAPNAAAVQDLSFNKFTFPKDYKYSDAKAGAPVAPKLIHWGTEDANNPAYAIETGKPQELRDAFAGWMTHPENPRFAAAIANRLWKRLFGLAVQEPVTDLDDLTKNANPELLAALTAEMKRVKFDLREFQRIILNTQAYQRQASLTPDTAKAPFLFAGPLLRRMTAEQAWDSVLALVVGAELDYYKLNRADDILRLNIPGDTLTGEAIVAKARELQANGGLRGNRGAGGKGKGKGDSVTADDYEGNPPPRFEGMTLARASELPQPSKEAHFLRMFGQSDKQLTDGGSLEGGVPQVLMLMNGEVQKVIASSASRVLKDAAAQSGADKQVESLYFSFLGRRPSLGERTLAGRSLSSGLSLADLTWALFNSREFIFIQ